MDNLEYQIYDWYEDHQKVIIDSDEDDEDIPGDYIIHTFGRCINGQSVYAKITDYTPYFYILLPLSLQDKDSKVLNKFKSTFEKFIKTDKNVRIYYKYKLTLKEIEFKKMKCCEGFTNDKEYYYLRLIFTNYDGMKKYKNYFENNDIVIPSILELQKPYKFKIYEANLPPMLRCFHIRNISGCSWIKATNFKLITNHKESKCDIEIIISWRNLIPIKKEFNAPLRIASFDIECNSIDGEFPQAKREGDTIIQIGVTYTYLGESHPYKQYIACLNETSKINNIELHSFETEKELLRHFLLEIDKEDCDILTGYNIFFFDEKYIYDRAKKLNIDNEFSFMSKLNNFKCEFKEIKLASSALGENILKFWNTPGRIHIDLMKDIQKTFNLPSYKLDYVASNFIRGEVLSYNINENDIYELKCKNVNDIFANDYIHLEVIKGFVSDDVGEKYLVIDIKFTDNIIIIKGNEHLYNELEKAKLGGMIYWSQAKDDVGPKDIFKLQKGTPNDRAIIAKYCIKDCKLVNLLINKLEVITKNIEMSNVCYVPLSYLFIRGQGIKLFSLCLKEFREQKYVFPVIKCNKTFKCKKCNNIYINIWNCNKCKSKEREELELETTTFEGAIVFPPVPKVEYEGISTLDYMSLYPSAIIHKNMSHETIVENSEYDNIEGITYFNAQFRDSDGTIKYCRYAKKDDKLGVIPIILDKLLKERKLVKKKMNSEKDPFKYKILDAKQFALKITANSLYGQLGASTSQIFKREIAACTTSTGREMLILAKKYTEEKLPWIINTFKYYNNINDTDKINLLYNLELKNKTNKWSEEFIKYIDEINNLTFQPVVRYGDTDSIFTCYRFRENCELVNKEESINILINLLEFSKILIEPFLNNTCNKILTDIYNKYYSKEKITDLIIPKGPSINIDNDNYSNEQKIKLFIKEYIYESYIPLLWTLIELIEKNYTNMYDIKLLNWIEHLLNKYNIPFENLAEKRKKFLLNDILDYINEIYNNNYITSTDETINKLVNKFYKNYGIIDNFIGEYTNNNINIKNYLYNNYDINKYEFNKLLSDNNCNININIVNKFITEYNNNLPFKFYKEISFDKNKLFLLCKNLLNSIIKEKWINSDNKKELIKLTQEYIDNISTSKNYNFNEIYYYISTFLKNNKELDIYKLTELLKVQLLSDDVLNIDFMSDKINIYTQGYIEKYLKNYGKKTMDEIILSFIEKDLNLNINKYITDYYNKVTNYIKSNFCKLDMTNMEKGEQNYYYWIHPYWTIKSKEDKLKKYILEEDIKNIHNIEDVKNYLIKINKKIDDKKLNKILDNEIIYNIKIYIKGQPIIDTRTVKYTINMGKYSSELIKKYLPFPHDLEYEKTFWPFAILTKKKYVGNKYEFDYNKFKQDFMGIVLKRRDNAPVVKEICGGIIDFLINHKSPEKALEFTKNCIENMFNGKYNIKYFLQSRKIKMKESYKDWTKIAHIYLADKIAQRDPGNIPQSGDRIEFAVIKLPVIKNNNVKLLQGDIIETPQYIKDNNLQIDYLFYLNNQIMNPALQFLELVNPNAKLIFDNFIDKYCTIKKKNVIKNLIKNLIIEIKYYKKLCNFNISKKKIKTIENFFKKIKY